MRSRVVMQRASHNPNVLMLAPSQYGNYIYTRNDLQAAAELKFTVSSLDYIEFDEEGELSDAEFTYGDAAMGFKSLEVYKNWWDNLRNSLKEEYV